MKYEKILLIDDDEDDQEIFLLAMEQVSKDISCLTTNSASSALEKLASKEFTADIIFLDLNMPEMNGQQFLLEIKKNEDLKNHPCHYLFNFISYCHN